MPTTVVNIRKRERADVYIGRPGPFGNPYVIGADGDRDEVIRLYRNYFYERLARDADWKKLVDGLRGRSLGCFCAPLSCHGHVIAEYLDGKA